MTKWMKSLALLIALSVTGIASGSTGDQAHDGKWWLSVDQDQRLGFVAGYMDCHVFVRKGPLPFLESWYQKEDDPAEINPKRESKKIADVLYTFKDKSTTTAASKKKP